VASRPGLAVIDVVSLIRLAPGIGGTIGGLVRRISLERLIRVQRDTKIPAWLGRGLGVDGSGVVGTAGSYFRLISNAVSMKPM
jgi:hypothetical protein